MGRNNTHRRSIINVRWLAAGLTTIIVGVSSCASDHDSSSAATVSPAIAAGSAAPADQSGDVGLTASPELAANQETPDAAAAIDAVALPQATPFGTALAITAAVSVEVDDVREAVIALPDLVTAKGGAIFDSTVEVGDPKTAVATVTIKVQPQDLESMISGLGGLGQLTARTQETDDVADEIADTDARIKTAQASVDRVRLLLAQATNLSEVTQIESELTIRETNLEQLLASQRSLTDRVQLATLTVTLVPAVEEPVVVVPQAEKPTTVGRALSTGWHTFTDAAHGIAVALAYVAPFLGIAAIVGLFVLVVWRRSRRPGRAVADSAVG